MCSSGEVSQSWKKIKLEDDGAQHSNSQDSACSTVLPDQEDISRLKWEWAEEEPYDEDWAQEEAWVKGEQGEEEEEEEAPESQGEHALKHEACELGVKEEQDPKQEEGEMEKVEMRHYQTAEELVGLLQSGCLRQVATSMSHKIGLDLSDHPKTALSQFLERYTTTTAERIYRYTEADVTHGGQVMVVLVAELSLPQFFNRGFKGFAYLPDQSEAARDQAKKEAEIAACRVFVRDPEVVEVAGKLPPSLTTIRRRLALTKKQKDALEAEGYDLESFTNELVQQVFVAFRDDFDCRIALWDGQ
mmetsp:Transcript_52080/g.97424  ORF Transcript_52080/g.97424 Transcript_52080/m.97424 type:complete len:302 (+) Transcript_52080:33-938(+)